MVDRQNEHMFLVAQSEQGGPQQRSFSQIKGALGLFGGHAPDLALPVGFTYIPHLHHWQSHLQTGGDHLDRLTLHGRKGTPQNFVSLKDFVEASLQQGHIKQTREANGFENVV